MRYITNTKTGRKYIIDNGVTPAHVYKQHNPAGLIISERSIGRLLSGEKQDVAGFRISAELSNDNKGVKYAGTVDTELQTRPKLRKRQPMQCHVQLTETGRKRLIALAGVISALAYYLAATGTAEYSEIGQHFGWSRAYTSTKVAYMLKYGLVTLKKESGAINK